MAMWGRATGGAVVAAALLLSGCAVPGEEPWAAEAQAWFAGYDKAFADASLEHALYYAPDGVTDTWDYYAEGRWAAVMLQSISFEFKHDLGPLYLSRDAAVRTHIMRQEPVNILLAHTAMVEDGIQRYTHLAHSEYLYTIRHRQGEAMALAEQVAGDYVEAWNTADPALIGQCTSPTPR